jgi:tetratricopeptide (TPR) repeat protein
MISTKINELYDLDEKIGQSLPVEKRMSLKLFKQAEFSVAKGELTVAISQLEQALSLSEEGFILKAIGEVYLRQNELNSAAVYLERYIKKNPSDVEVLSSLGHIYRRSGKINLAVKYFERATNLNPKDNALWHYRGLCESLFSHKHPAGSTMANKYLEQASESFRNAIRERPMNVHEKHYNAVNYHLLAKCLIQIRDIKGALLACKAGLLQESSHSGLRDLASTLGISYQVPYVTAN